MDQLVNALFTTKHRALHRVIDCRPDKGELNHVYRLSVPLPLDRDRQTKNGSINSKAKGPNVWQTN